MKKATTLLIIIVLLVQIAACQMAPETPAVIGKGDNKLNDIIANGEAKADNSFLKEIATYITDKYDTYEKNTKVFLDADIVIPDVTDYPVIQVIPHTWSAEELQTLIDKMLPNICMYKADLTRTKDMIEKFILTSKQKLNDPHYFDDLDDDMKELKIQSLKDYIKQMEQEYITAPKSKELIEITMPEFLKINDTNISNQKNTLVHFYDKSTDEMVGSGVILSNNDFIGRANKYDMTVVPQEERYQATMKKLTIDENKALEYADAYIKKIGMDAEFTCKWIEPHYGEGFHRAYYTRNYSNIPVEYVVSTAPMEEASETAYTSLWKEEYIRLDITDNGVENIIHNAPSDVLKVLNENVQLLSFEKILESFKTNSKYIGIYSAPSKYLESREIHINEIKLGLMRVQIKDKQDEYMMVPVWDFMGYNLYEYHSAVDAGNGFSYTPDGINVADKGWEATREKLSLLTVNAIDGTIINRMLGY